MMSEQKLEACKACGQTIEPDLLGGYRLIKLDENGICLNFDIREVPLSSAGRYGKVSRWITVAAYSGT